MICVFSWQNSINLCPNSFHIPRPNLSVTPGVSWLPTFAFQSPIMKRNLIWVLVLEGLLLEVLESLVGLHRIVQLQLLQGYWLGHRLGLLWYWMVCLGNRDHSVIFKIAFFKYCISDSLFECDGYSISSKGFLPLDVYGNIYYHMWNRSPVQVRCMWQGTQGWCTGMTLRDGMWREVGGGFRTGDTCTPMAVSCQCMAKTTTILSLASN